MKLYYLEIRTVMDSQLELLEDRLKVQEKEVEDLMEILKKRAEIEKEYSKEMEKLSQQMRKKHKDIMSTTSSYVTSVENVVIQLIIETGDLAR